MLHSRADSVAR
jgi:hypothetical protein